MNNKLDGLTILRFAKAFKSGGGIEQYIENLDYILLKRNKVKVILMYLENESNKATTTYKEIGQGSLIEIPMPVSIDIRQSISNKHNSSQLKIPVFHKIFREMVIYNPLLYRIIFRNIIKRKYPRSGLLEISNAGEKISKIIQEYKVDLLVMHHIGTIDSAEIIEEAKKLKIPYIFINHYSNDGFANVSIREQLFEAAGVGGVSSRNVPKYLKYCYENLMDGIDIDYFCKPVNTRIKERKDEFILTLPARICEGKGHSDIIEAADRLIKKGLSLKIVFAGREDSAHIRVELQKKIKQLKLDNAINFAGHLNRLQLRELYAASSVVVMPTYSEGLGRVLLEAQSMELPVIAYNVGGVPDAIIPGKTGYLVNKGDIKQLADRIEDLLIDSEKRIKLGQEGRKFITERFSNTRLAERHENWYLKSIQNSEMKPVK